MATLVELRDITRQYERAYGRRRHYSGTVTDTTSDALVVPTGVQRIGVSVVPGTDAIVQFTMSSYDDIEADTAVWDDWEEGTVTAQVASSIEGFVTAIRMTSTGASTWRVSA